MVRIEELKGHSKTRRRPFNPDSPSELSAILFNKPDDAEQGLGIKPLKKIKTGYSTDAETSKTRSTPPSRARSRAHRRIPPGSPSSSPPTSLALKEAIHPETHRIHPSFNQTVAVTGRLVVGPEPPEHPHPHAHRARDPRASSHRGSVLISADYSQIELRLLAHLSGTRP